MCSDTAMTARAPARGRDRRRKGAAPVPRESVQKSDSERTARARTARTPSVRSGRPRRLSGHSGGGGGCSQKAPPSDTERLKRRKEEGVVCSFRNVVNGITLS